MNPSTDAEIDHLILGAAELESAMKAFEQRTGVKPVHGGVHPSLGTENALVSLAGGVYLEIIAPDRRRNSQSAIAVKLSALQQMIPVGWAVRTKDAAALWQKLEAEGFRPGSLSAGNRDRPDGVKLTWMTFGVSGFDELTAPFFIQWGEMREHPSRTAPAGCHLHSVKIEGPHAKRLQQLVRFLSLRVSVQRAATSRIGVELDCPNGAIHF